MLVKHTYLIMIQLKKIGKSVHRNFNKGSELIACQRWSQRLLNVQKINYPSTTIKINPFFNEKPSLKLETENPLEIDTMS